MIVLRSKKIGFGAMVLCGIALSTTASAQVYELRTYTANQGKLESLNARFRDHTTALFEKYGIESVAYWVSADDAEAKNTLVCILKHQSREAAKKSFDRIRNDPAREKAYAETEAAGPLLAQPPESVFLVLTNYSPAPTEMTNGNGGVFELRTYTLREGKRTLIDARSRDHAIRIFRRHGMESIGFWHPIGSPDSRNKFVYMLRHETRERAKENWKALGSDPEWRNVKRESEVEGRFTATFPQSVFLTPTDWSPLR